MMKQILLCFFLMTISLGYAQPAASPSDPPSRNAWDVKSVYSDSYTNEAGVAFLNFGGSTINADYTPPGGTPAKYYTGHSYSGMQVNAAGSLNVFQMTHLHFDVYSPNFSSMAIKLESSTGAARELAVTGAVVPSASTRDQWISVDLALSTYDTGNILTSLKYIVPVTFGQNATLYIDNVYFYRPATTQPPTLGSFTVPSQLIGAAPITLTAPTSNSAGAFTFTSSNTAVATISGTTLTIVGPGSSNITATQAADGPYGTGSAIAVFNVTPNAAPVPPARNTWDVISLYSGAYTNLANTNFNPNWGQSGFGAFSATTFEGDAVLQYPNLNYQGTETAADVNAIAMTKMHIDIYSPTLTSIRLSLIKTTGGAVEKSITLPLTAGVWNSFDIDLTSATFTGLDFTKIRQLKYDQPSAAGQTLVVDNIYFWRNATTLPPTLGAFTVAPQLIGAAPFTLTAPTSNSNGAFTFSSNNTAVATVSGTTVTVVGAGSAVITATQAADSGYGVGIATATLDVTPTAAPTPPARNTWDVISLYSGSYTNLSGTNFNPNWGQSGFGAFSTASYEGNEVLRYPNLNYQGTETAADVNVLALNKLHIDLFSPTLTSIRLSLIKVTGGAVEKPITLPLTAGVWNSFDIDLTASTFTGLDFTKIRQLKYDAPSAAGQTLSVDNIYFWRDATTQPPTLGSFTVAAQLIGAAPFELTAPTSNSAGAFTFTSSNTAVATVSGTTVTVVGAGSTTITATQAADGSYGTGVATATLNVTPPAAPTPPTRNAWDVISLYSGAYTPSSSPNWGAAGSDVSLSGDTARFFNGFTLSRLAFAATNVSEMTHLHIDVFSLNQNPLWFELNGNRRVTSTPVNGWVSVDIALSEFVGLNLTNVSFFDLNNPTGASLPVKQVYLDNIYFYRTATLQPPTIGALTVPSGVTMGDAPFVLTNPTTNSSGTFSYTSSNTAVATISGNTVTIVGGGSTIITATVATDGVYGPRSTTATLNVAFAIPGASPIPPAREAARVMSVYTGTPAQVYANSPAYNLVRSNWTAGTTANFNFANGTNTCIQVNNLGFIGLVDQTERRLNVTGMTHLHLDVYCNAPLSNLFVFLLAPGDRNYNTGPLVAGWNSLSIPLTSYPGALNDIYGFKIEQNVAPNTTQIYLDNIYFSNDIFTYYQDNDGDGFGNAAATISAVTPPTGYVTNSTDCDDNDNLVWQSGSFYVDFDNDGYHLDLSPESSVTTLCYGADLAPYYIASTLGADCDDTNGLVWRSGAFYVDADADGYSPNASSETVCYGASSPSGYSVASLGLDCDDAIAAVNPGHVEVLYNGVDDNCDGQLDEGFQLTTALQSVSCGATLPTMGSLIYANINNTASGYRFKVVNNTTGATQIINRSFHWFALNMLADYQYATTYTISVELQRAGIWLGYYGSACDVSSPAILSPTGALQVNPSQCGATLASIGSVIATTPVSGATGYRFRVTDITPGATGDNLVQVKDRSYHWFTLPMLSRFNYGSTYMVEVAVKTTAGYSGYGSACMVYSPAVPTLVDCGGVIATDYSLVRTSPLNSITQYRFQVTKVSDQSSVTFDTNKHWFSFRVNVPGFTSGAQYAVRVAVMTAGTWSPFGDACEITAPTASTRVNEVAANEFTVEAYPNPYSTEFKLNVATSTEGAVDVRVYDMLGKLIETRSINTIDYISEDLGSAYPAGVYNVIVTQGENAKTLRMIKR
ncbi:MAG: T9SS type A sorting domain-containing protein [Flavobacterium sp.]|nr:T9SS type A sorting domain-containing protein [Flavobacterium sp.]